MSEVVLERYDPGVVVVRINRAEKKNALNMNARRLLADHVAQATRDPTARCIVLTGGRECFVAGSDLRDMVDWGPLDPALFETQRLWQTLTRCPLPVIAAVNGYAWGGGCELAMHADIIIAGESASFAQPEVKLGIMPGAGGTQRLTRAIGKFKAMRLLLSGDPISAADALAAGLVSEVVSDDRVQDHAMELARKICALPPLAVAQIKEAVLAGQDTSLESAMLLERKAFQLLFASEDRKDRMAAFLARRDHGKKGE